MIWVLEGICKGSVNNALDNFSEMEILMAESLIRDLIRSLRWNNTAFAEVSWMSILRETHYMVVEDTSPGRSHARHVLTHGTRWLATSSISDIDGLTDDLSDAEEGGVWKIWSFAAWIRRTGWDGWRQRGHGEKKCIHSEENDFKVTDCFLTGKWNQEEKKKKDFPDEQDGWCIDQNCWS